MGSFIGPHTMQATVNLLTSGKLELNSLITHRISLSNFGVGLEAMRKGEAIEVIIVPDNE
jgi:Zn-dependent alcohol dehydrogenase